MSEELVPWLRAEIEADLVRHRRIERARRRVDCESDELYVGARHRVAQLEAELAVLELHDGEPLETDLPDGDYQVRQVCTRCDDGYWPCRTVRLIGYGYRYRPGYREEWKP